jgi:hypothetical protein
MNRRLRLALPILVGLVVLIASGVYLVASKFPSVGAHGADLLREMVGDQAVAHLETASFEIEDAVRTFAHKLGRLEPLAPWSSTVRGGSGSLSGASADVAPSNRSIAESTSVDASHWPPRPLAALGSLPGEGQWSPYLRDSTGQMVAYRTFLHPDPKRPYAIAAVVAFDLDRTTLGFVLGTQEPASEVAFDRPGTIPAYDRRPGKLLAAFNGGFKTRHGSFGVMVGGVVLIPPRDGFGTVELTSGGRVRIGIWGTEIVPSPDVRTWRQNGPLIVHDGKVNPHTADTAPRDWGHTVGGATATWRSALGISADDATLFYLAGPSLTLSALVSAVAACGARQAIQLDINDYWVHFDAIDAVGSKLRAVPLLDSMKDGAGRYLGPYSRDYFYVIAH